MVTFIDSILNIYRKLENSIIDFIAAIFQYCLNKKSFEKKRKILFIKK